MNWIALIWCWKILKRNYHSIKRQLLVVRKKIATYIYGRTTFICLLHNFTKRAYLIRPSTTHFSTSYLTLGCLHDNKWSLIRMFTSKEWQSSQFVKTRDEKLVKILILDKGFWKNILHCMRGVFPLMKVLHVVDSNNKSAMGFI